MKILVVEDDVLVRRGLVKLLTAEGFDVDEVGDGEEGLYRAREWQYDLIILDVMLPEQDGWQVTENLRRLEKDTPVLMLTALSETDDLVKGLNLGADEFMTKPYNERELLARIRALTRRSKGNAKDEIALGSALINVAEKTIYKDGEPVDLTAKQYRIVEYLALRAGKVVSRDELMEFMFGENEDSISNLIDVHVHNIRRKLGKDFLQSRRGLGYIIPAP